VARRSHRDSVVEPPLHGATPSTGLPSSFDLGTFATQQNMAVMSVALLALGSSISYHHQRARSVAGRGNHAAPGTRLAPDQRA
jgi:hypothetical protein